MKKIILTLLFIFTIFSFANISTSNAEYSKSMVFVNNNTDNSIELAKKVENLERKMYVDNLIQRIEFESEIIIPNAINVKYVEYTYNLANQLKLPTRTVFRLMYTESRFIDTLTSSKGARGLMQLMPNTRNEYYTQLRVDTLKLDNNQEDIYIALNMLKDLHKYWKSKGHSEKYSWKLTLASYNSGSGSVKKYRGIPPYTETIDFVNFISKSPSNPEFYFKYIRKYENTVKISS